VAWPSVRRGVSGQSNEGVSGRKTEKSIAMNADWKLARMHLESAAQAKDKTRRSRWLMSIGAIALLAMVSFATLDYWLLLSGPLRYATSTLLAAVAILGGWRL